MILLHKKEWILCVYSRIEVKQWMNEPGTVSLHNKQLIIPIRITNVLVATSHSHSSVG